MISLFYFQVPSGLPFKLNTDAFKSIIPPVSTDDLCQNCSLLDLERPLICFLSDHSSPVKSFEILAKVALVFFIC